MFTLIFSGPQEAAHEARMALAEVAENGANLWTDADANPYLGATVESVDEAVEVAAEFGFELVRCGKAMPAVVVRTGKRSGVCVDVSAETMADLAGMSDN